MNEIIKTVGERLKHCRMRKGLSQEQLAEKCGLHPTYIGQVERGEKNATIESIWKIANALELPLEVLFEKLVEYYSEEENLSAQAYNILDTLSKDDPRLMLTILNCIVKFRNNK